MDACLGFYAKPTLNENCLTVWDGICLLDDVVESVTTTVQNLESHHAAFQVNANTNLEAIASCVDGVVLDVGKGLSEITEFIRVLNEEQVLMHQQLQNQGRSKGFNSSVDSLALTREVNELKAKVTSLDSMVSSSHLMPTTTSASSSGDLANIKIQLKLLEARLTTHNILKLGGFVFQSRVDVALFVESKMPTNAFCMFHDVVTLMERLSGSYVEQKEVINELYQATKVGLDERKAWHAASFKIIYPTVFGYVKEGTTNVKNHLPAVKSFKEWNSFDAESGVKTFILNGMEVLKLQLYQDIANFFTTDRFYDARVLMTCTLSHRCLLLKCPTGWTCSIKNSKTCLRSFMADVSKDS